MDDLLNIAGTGSENDSKPRLALYMSIETRFNYLVGGLALLSTLSSVLWFSRNFRPSVQIKYLDELLQETVGLYDSYVADGLLEDARIHDEIKGELSMLQRSVMGVREETYKIRTTVGEYRALLHGGWKKIHLVSTQIMDFRAGLIRTSQKLRRDREALVACTTNNISHAGISIPAQPSSQLSIHGVSLVSTASNTTSPAPACALPIMSAHSLDTDSISLAPTLVGEGNWSRFRCLWSAMTWWHMFGTQSAAASEDIERGDHDLASPS